jgi:hypothetical protein
MGRLPGEKDYEIYDKLTPENAIETVGAVKGYQGKVILRY